MSGFTDTFYTQLLTAINYSAIAIFTLYSPLLHTIVSSVSLVVSWQRIHNSLTVTAAHYQVFFLPLFYQLPTLETPSILILESESESLYDWPFTANQFVLATSPLRLTTSNFFQMDTCGHSPYVTYSLTRGWVCRLQLLLGLASPVILRPESRMTHVHILLPQIRYSPNLEGQVPVFISPRNRVGRL
jgi:hypothetical protein